MDAFGKFNGEWMMIIGSSEESTQIIKNEGSNLHF